MTLDVNTFQQQHRLMTVPSWPPGFSGITPICIRMMPAPEQTIIWAPCRRDWPNIRATLAPRQVPAMT